MLFSFFLIEHPQRSFDEKRKTKTDDSMIEKDIVKHRRRQFEHTQVVKGNHFE